MMKSQATPGLLVFAALVAGATVSAGAQDMLLWYEHPAQKWVEALPVGNGRLGGMIFGGVAEERIQLNEDSIWSGQPHFNPNPKMRENLSVVRNLLFEGKYAEAHKLAGETMATPRDPRYGNYQPLGNLRIRMEGSSACEQYRRQLDLDSAISETTYRSGQVTYRRSVFASAVDQVLVIRLIADRPRQITCFVELSREQDAKTTVNGTDRLVMNGQTPFGGVRFTAAVAAIPEGGKVQAAGDSLRVEHANALTLLLAADSTFWHPDPRTVALDQLNRAAKQTHEQHRRSHLADYQRLFRRVSLKLPPGPAAARPTDVRLSEWKLGPSDPQLAALLFQYGRYLLISSSRPGSLPANLQGIWNDSYTPPWFSDYTININTEMNYWPAETCNLPELAQPLFDLIERLHEPGRQAARERYGCRGWVLGTRTPPWALSELRASVDLLWHDAAAWLCQHLWEHYQFAPDRKFLAERVYPILKETAEFYLDFLVEDPHRGWLISGPCTSPENKFIGPDGQKYSLSMGPTMSMQIIRDIFSECIAASQILGVDEEFSRRVVRAKSKLAPMQIGGRGQLQEWLEDYREVDPQHRHVSHLYGLHPSNQISPLTTPELAAAARKTLESRGDGGTGWSKAWKINFWARLHDGDHAHKMLSELLASSILPSLFDTHPPFQIDGNFGATAGIAEMLLQSQNGEIQLLPALPSAWPEGSVTGLRARGGLQVDIDWQNGKLQRVTSLASNNGTFKIRYGQMVREMVIAAGQTRVLDGKLEVAEDTSAAGDLDLWKMVRPVPLSARFIDDDWYIWCGAPTRTADGKYHLYYSRWPRKGGHNTWVTRSEIAYAVADKPLGPYRFVNVALLARGKKFWDGDCTHNPNILQKNGKFYLYYMGNCGDGTYAVSRNNQRVGLAIADRPEGPWKRFDKPIVDISRDKTAFDSMCVTNPAAVVRPDGGILLIYKAVEYVEGKLMGGKVRYGAALAEKPEGPYVKTPGRIFEAQGDTGDVWMLAEDPFIWYSKRYGSRYYAVARDVVGRFTGAGGGIALFQSEDGLNWKPACHPKVLGSQFSWADGTLSGTKLERPALLIEDGIPKALFGAVDVNQPRHRAHSFNVQIPLERAE
jgi:alpha-L-fucosidase 2